jgi:hypothetical protein
MLPDITNLVNTWTESSKFANGHTNTEATVKWVLALYLMGKISSKYYLL